MASEKCEEISFVCNRAAEHPPAGNLNFEQGKHRVRKANMQRQQSFQRPEVASARQALAPLRSSARGRARRHDPVLHEELQCRRKWLYRRTPTRRGSPFWKKDSFVSITSSGKKSLR